MDSSVTPELSPLPPEDDALIRRADVPRYLPLAAQTLARWAVEGGGPPYVKLGRRIVAYRAGDLRAWLRDGKRRSTSEPPPPKDYI
jgi:predicted DNA-binding transcriptional regulator AlpA